MYCFRNTTTFTFLTKFLQSTSIIVQKSSALKPFALISTSHLSSYIITYTVYEHKVNSILTIVFLFFFFFKLIHTIRAINSTHTLTLITYSLTWYKILQSAKLSIWIIVIIDHPDSYRQLMKFRAMKHRSSDHKRSLELQDKAVKVAFLQKLNRSNTQTLSESSYLFRYPTDFKQLSSLLAFFIF